MIFLHCSGVVHRPYVRKIFYSEGVLFPTFSRGRDFASWSIKMPHNTTKRSNQRAGKGVPSFLPKILQGYQRVHVVWQGARLLVWLIYIPVRGLWWLLSWVGVRLPTRIWLQGYPTSRDFVCTLCPWRGYIWSFFRCTTELTFACLRMGNFDTVD